MRLQANAKDKDGITKTLEAIPSNNQSQVSLGYLSKGGPLEVFKEDGTSLTLDFRDGEVPDVSYNKGKDILTITSPELNVTITVTRASKLLKIDFLSEGKQKQEIDDATASLGRHRRPGSYLEKLERRCRLHQRRPGSYIEKVEAICRQNGTQAASYLQKIEAMTKQRA